MYYINIGYKFKKDVLYRNGKKYSGIYDGKVYYNGVHH